MPGLSAKHGRLWSKPMKPSGKYKVSVVVTVFNEQDNLQLLLDALSRQTLKPFEIIIVDGGSTDNTWAILQKNKSIRSYKKPGNRSVGRNFAVSRSISPIIAFTDAVC